MSAAIAVRGLRKSYGGVEVLRGLDLEVAQGSVLALLGANGAGKTTAVRILATLLTADAGTAEVDGHDVRARPLEVRRSISLTGQSAAVDDVLTGRENLVLVARLRRVASPKAVAGDLLVRFGLAGAADRRAGTYSGGMRRRLDIAMSLVGDPAVLFLDEPTTGLDPEARRRVWDTVRDLARSGRTVLLTTQHLDEAEALADRIAILHEGRVVVTGSLDELRRLLPEPEVQRVARQPTLEEVFLAVVTEPSAGAHGAEDREDAR